MTSSPNGPYLRHQYELRRDGDEAGGGKEPHHHHQQRGPRAVPKGCIGIMVGMRGEEQQQRFVIPVVYMNHPLFMQLLKEAEEEYGFDHKGPITIPCRVDRFHRVQDIIDSDGKLRHRRSRHQSSVGLSLNVGCFG